MEKDILNAYIDKANVPAEALSIKYDFTTGYTGIGNNDFILFNEVYPTGTQYYDAPEQKIIANYSPAVPLIDQPHSITGDGLFEGSGILAITNEINDDAWTAFFKLKPSLVEKDRSKGQVLLSTIESGAADTSGFRFGINGANKLFLEYPHNLDHQDVRIATLTDHRLALENIISLSYDGNLAEISSHNFNPDKTERDYVDLSGYNKSDQWYIGNNVSVPDKNIDPVYTGYSGYIDDFIYFNEYLTVDQKDIIAESFFVKSYIAETTGEITGIFNLVTGSEISGIFLESGITGYETGLYETYDQLGGGAISTYYSSGISGAISGEIIVELTGSATGAFSEKAIIAEQIEYDDELISKVNKDYNVSIVLNRHKVDLDDNIEIYSRTVQNLNVNLRPTYDSDSKAGSNRFDLAADETFINLYRNGILQSPPSVNLITGDRMPVIIYDSDGSQGQGTDLMKGEAYELDYRSIKSGQRYYFDTANDDVDYPNIYPGTIRVTTGTPEWALEHAGGGGVSNGYITASRDGFSIIHMDSASSEEAMSTDYAGGWPVGSLNPKWSLTNYGGIKSTLKLDIGEGGTYEIYDNNKIKNVGDHSFEKNDVLLYDKPSEAHHYYMFTGAGMDASRSITVDNKNIEDVIVLSGDSYVDKDIFVNGVKLVSGTLSELENPGMEVEYTWGSYDINGVATDVSVISTSGFSSSTLGVGDTPADLYEQNDPSLLQFIPHVTGDSARFTGAGQTSYDVGISAVSEQLWFNGQRGTPSKSEFTDLNVSDAQISYLKVNKDGLGNAVPQTYIDFSSDTASINDVTKSHPFLTRIFDQEFKFGFDVGIPSTGEKYFAITPV